MAVSRSRKIPLFTKMADNILSKSSLEVAHGAHAVGPAAQDEGGGGEHPSLHPQQVDPMCQCCQVRFKGRAEQVAHYKLDWHRYNIKRRLRGLECVDQGQFERLAGASSLVWE